MAFDEAKWRAAAEAEGYGKEDQDAFLAARSQAPAQPASAPASAPAQPEAFGAATERFMAKGKAEQTAAKQARDVQAGPFTIPDWMTTPLAVGAAGAAGYGAKALVDKLRSPSVEMGRIEPSFNLPPDNPPPPPPPPPAADPLLEAKIRNEQAKAALQEFKLEQAKQGKASVAPPTAASVAAPAVPTAPVQTPANIAQVQQQAAEALASRQAPVAPAAVAPAAPTPPVAPVAPPTVAPATVAPVAPTPVPPPQLAPSDLAAPENTPAAKEAEKKAREKLTYKSPADLPVGTTFRPDLGTGDKWLINTTGPERRKLILNEFNQGKPAGSYEEGQKLYQKYLEKYPKENLGPVLPKEEAKARGIKPPESFGGWGKAVKVGGVAGVLLTAAELAQAAQKSQKDKGASLKELAFNAMGMIPGLGTAFNAATFSSGLNVGEEKELARRRGIAPPIQR